MKRLVQSLLALMVLTAATQAHATATTCWGYYVGATWFAGPGVRPCLVSVSRSLSSRITPA
jgi:hypothetical protein